MSFAVGEVVVVITGTRPGFTPGTEHTVVEIHGEWMALAYPGCPVPNCAGPRYEIGKVGRACVLGCETCLRKKRPPQRSTQELVDELMSKIQSPEEELA